MSSKVTAPAPPAEKAVSFWTQTITAITSKKAAALDKMAQLKARAGDVALKVVLGDAEAKREMEGLNKQGQELDGDVRTLAAAETAAKEELGKSQAAAEAERARERLVRCEAIASRAVAQAAVVDELMVNLAHAGDGFKNTVRELFNESGDAGLGNSMLFAGVHFEAAARRAGMQRHMDMKPEWSAALRGSLADATKSHLAEYLKEE